MMGQAYKMLHLNSTGGVIVLRGVVSIEEHYKFIILYMPFCHIHEPFATKTGFDTLRGQVCVC